MMKQIIIFSNRYPFLGPILWILSVQYFVAQWVVAAAWPFMYSLKNNYISDLGNTSCSVYDGMSVCSPLHGLMNLSFVVFGITITLGSILIYTEFKSTKLALVGFALMGLSGLGTIMVGLFPENTIGQLHVIGAFLGLVVGNISIVTLAFVLRGINRSFRLYTLLTGVICLVAFLLYYTDTYLGLGRGGMERVVSYPFTAWMIAFGLYMSKARLRAKRKNLA